ncbi:hypothetical protein HPB51_009633 [Rhipicephalus microplus]|uniref:THAP-type domain-containing protein n=1 Tax=Rhipicephalus microplus TaxID=6941 RepID=A0A9J6E8I9_RHIMP|nr:hypothetical protein HPB51_009633 [Rhipicephalus microplus]
MTCSCAFGCRNWTEDGNKLFRIPRGKQNLTRRKVWLHRIGRKDFEPSATPRLCEADVPDMRLEPQISAPFPTESRQAETSKLKAEVQSLVSGVSGLNALVEELRSENATGTAGSPAPYIVVMDVQSPEIPPSTSSSTGIASRKRGNPSSESEDTELYSASDYESSEDDL